MTCYICKCRISRRDRAFYVPLPGRTRRRRCWCVQCDANYPDAVQQLLAEIDRKETTPT